MAYLPRVDVARLRLAPISAIAFASLALAQAANAKLYVFGDSLSDNGNIDKVTFGVEPGDDYWNGRFSNGPVWSELLGYRLGKAPGLLYYDPVFTSRVDGYNFAHAGAAAVERWYLPDFLEAPGQTSYYARQVRKGRMSGKSNDIATLWIGGNDYLLYNEGSAPTVVAGVMKSLTALDATGVGRIVLMNLPTLGEIPGEITGTDRTKLNTLSLRHNALLKSAVAAYKPQARAQITQVDVAALFTAVRRGAGGFTVTKPGDRGSRTGTCKGDGLLLAACPANYFFYDGVHPTASGHRFIAGVVRDRLAAPVAVAARVSLGTASALPGMTAQLDQIRLRFSETGLRDGTYAYAFGSPLEADDADDARSSGFGADWRTGDLTIGFNAVDASTGTALNDDIMSASGAGWGYSLYAAWRDDGLSATMAMTSSMTGLDYVRQTEIAEMPVATGSGHVTASTVQFGLAQEIGFGNVSLQPEATILMSQMAFSSFTESGTFGLSDNTYDAASVAGSLAIAGTTLRYSGDDWGVSVRAYGAVNIDGDASVWLAAPTIRSTSRDLVPNASQSGYGAGVTANAWLAGDDMWSVSLNGAAFSDMARVEGTAQVSFRYEF